MEAIGRAAAGIAYDFNNLLAAVRSFAGFLVEDLAAGSEHQRFARRILQACERGEQLIGQLLAFARADGVKQRVLDLRSTLEAVCDLLRVLLPPSTTLRIEPGPESLPVRSNDGQLHQLLLNLCLNANDALGGEPGTITIRLARRRAGRRSRRPAVGHLEPGRDYARLTVTDTGAGMDAATLRRIFEPFFTTKVRGRGSGLGLAVVHEIVTSCDGAVHVDSAPGRGTAFMIDLPLADAAARADPRRR